MCLRKNVWLRLATLAIALPLFAQTARAEMRAIWIWGSTIESVGAETAASQLQAQGITDAIVLVKGLEGTAYYASSIVPRATSDDVLGDFLIACHARGIKVHAWLIYNEDDYYAAKNNYEYTLYHVNKTSSTSPYAMNTGKICPLRAQEDYNQYFFNTVNELLQNYKLDGIHLDSIRYSHAVYCFCPKHVAKAEELGIDIDHVKKLLQETYYSPADGTTYFDAYANGDSDVVKWVSERESEINLVVKTVRDMVDAFNAKHRTDIAVSAALMPEGSLYSLTTTYARSDQYADAHYAQDYSLMSPMLTFISPMAYYYDYGETPSWVGDVVAGSIKHARHTPVIAGVQTYSGVTAQNIVDEIYSARWNGAAGFNLFQYATTSSDEWSAIVPTLAKMETAVTTAFSSGYIDNSDIADKLLKKLNAAENYADQSNIKAEENQLHAYIQEVSIFSGRHIDVREAQILVRDAEWLINLIDPNKSFRNYDLFTQKSSPWMQ